MPSNAYLCDLGLPDGTGIELSCSFTFLLMAGDFAQRQVRQTSPQKKRSA